MTMDTRGIEWFFVLIGRKIQQWRQE
jgi:hypothetical protein